MLRAVNVEKRFDGLQVLKSVNVSIESGEVVAIIGSSGSGKSTFLRCVNMLEKIDGGSISIKGEMMADTSREGIVRYAPDADLRRMRLKMGMVFQNYHLFPHFSVIRNVTEAQTSVLRRGKSEAREYALELLAKVGLSDKADQYPYQLSGGQCQRVAIARALAIDPEILCFDEPTSALDPLLTQEVLAVIRALANEKRTMIVVTHEMTLARDVADKVIFMADGVIKEEGVASEVLGSEKSRLIREFIGERL